MTARPTFSLPIAPLVDGVDLPVGRDPAIDVVNPSTGRLLYTMAAGDEADVNRAVASARRSFEQGDWSDGGPQARKRILHRLADLVIENAYTLDALDAEEMGKPVSESFCNAASAGAIFRFAAEAIDKLVGDVLISDRRSMAMQRLCPRGVVGAITSWNFPIYVAALKVAPALAAGNSVVLKPSELASRSSILLGRLALEAGLPAGVFNVVPGLGTTVGKALAMHMDVDMLTFTGSTTVGKLLTQYAGMSNLKLVKAECGGKSPQIVFADCNDIEEAARAVARNLMTNQGQICSVGSRLLIERAIEHEFTARLSELFKQKVMGPAIDSTTTFGPIVSEQQLARVTAFVEEANADGFELATGGSRALPESGGFFFEPTLFRNVRPDAKIAQEEVFGPVLAVLPFDTESEAIQLANYTRYGLAAYAWTTDLSRGMRLAKGVRSGITVNAATPSGEGAGFAFSFEPAGQSGFGVEGGTPGIASYMRRQSIRFNYG